MEAQWLRIVIWSLAITSNFPTAVKSAPVTVSFSYCRNATYTESDVTVVYQCCPDPPTKPAIDWVAPPVKALNVRKASQCTDEAYDAKLEKAVALMRALPDDDPRSWLNQWQIHCAYCGGSFLTTNASGIAEGIDIHFSWLFYPWHRWFLYFHERILQSLLGDPTFTLNFWDWGTPYGTGDGDINGASCFIQGDNFPPIYAIPDTARYDVNRSQNAKGNGRLHFPDLNFNPSTPAVDQANYNATEEQLIQSNLNVMHRALITGGTTAETFVGAPYHAGDPPGLPVPPPQQGGGGSLEVSAHSAIHFWTGQDPPINQFDMGVTSHTPRDPVFYAHHSNMDRLFTVWKEIGPILGVQREYYNDSDFYNAEFLLYDENKDLVRVKVVDALDTTKLGYIYQGANDAAWIFLNQTRCANLSYTELISEANSLSVPTKKNGLYYLQAGTTFTLVIERPLNYHGLEEFLVIDGIELDKSKNAGFDVFIDLLNPTNYIAPSRCAEYGGRFISLAKTDTSEGRSMVWKHSITKVLVHVQAPDAPSKVVITIVPLSPSGGCETIAFSSIQIRLNFVNLPYSNITKSVVSMQAPEAAGS